MKYFYSQNQLPCRDHQLIENLKIQISDLQEENKSTKETLEKSVDHVEYQSN